MYASLVNLRETELFLPSTVRQPPLLTPPSAVSTDGLFVRPSLTSRKSLYVVRVDVSHHHRRFGDVETKKQAVHHHLVRFLSTIDDAVASIVPSAVVQQGGAYATVLLDIVSISSIRPAQRSPLLMRSRRGAKTYSPRYPASPSPLPTPSSATSDR